LGIICGHDHVFAAFKRNNVYAIIAGSGGGTMDLVNSTMMDGR